MGQAEWAKRVRARPRARRMTKPSGPSASARGPERGGCEAQPRVVTLTQRKFFPAELEALVAHAGLRVVARYSNFAWQPLVAGAESQVLVCEPEPHQTPKRRR